jgi:hypothetical protein
MSTFGYEIDAARSISYDAVYTFRQNIADPAARESSPPEY